MFDVIIAAAGESGRFGEENNKLLQVVRGLTVLENSARPFFAVDGLEKVIIATSEKNFDAVSEIARRLGGNTIVCRGGATRTDTVKNALNFVDADYVLVHDGARPFVTEKIIRDVLKGAQNKGAAVPLVNIIDSVADVSDKYRPLVRSSLRAVQTPQGFKTKLIKSAYDEVSGVFTDDVSVYLQKYGEVEEVEGDGTNKKITVPEDLQTYACRIGSGFDTHLLAAGRKLVLGGIEIPFDKGLLGHSDADVLTHAVMDALLSAAGLRDIGFYFPDTDEKYDGANSMKLLKEVMEKLTDKGYRVGNLSATVIAQKPRLSPYIPQIVQNLSKALNVASDNVGILATTTEGIGREGEGRAISAFATVTIIQQ